MHIQTFVRFKLYASFLSPSAAADLYIHADNSQLYKNGILLEGDGIIFSEMVPEAALQQEIAIVQKKHKKAVHKRLTVGLYAASMQGRVHISLKYAIVRSIFPSPSPFQNC